MMELPHEIRVGVPLMRSSVEATLERLEIDPKHADPAVIYRHACEEAVDHYMIHSDDHRLRCAIGVLIVLLLAHGRKADHDKVVEELQGLNAISAAQTGVPVDFDRVFGDEERDASYWVGLIRIWQEVKRDGK